MIQLKNSTQISIMKEAGRITGEAILLARDSVKPGISTWELDKIIQNHIERSGAKPSFLGYGGFPASACISINDEIIHGIPSKDRILQEGDIVKIDTGAFYKGFHGDSARTIPVGRISIEAQKLIDTAKESFLCGVREFGMENKRIGDVGYAIDSCIKANGFTAVRKYIGHGVGHELHEAPDVPNFGTPGRGVRICRGFVVAIEPMVNAGTHAVVETSSGWTVKTADGRLSAHYENTVALTADGVIILTEVEKGY